MDKKKLKEKLHRQIDDLEDEMALQMLHEAAAEYAKAEETDVEDELTPEQLKRLEQSIEQHRNGKTYTHEEVQKKIQEWLSR